MDIEQLEHYTAMRCIPDYDYGLFSRFLVICQFTPLYLTIGMCAVSLTYKNQEIYYRFFSIGLSLNWLLNLFLQYVIQSEPHIKNCGKGYSMPSWHSQHVFFFYSMIITYLIIRKKTLPVLNLMILNSVPSLVCAARLMLGFNTFSELMVGNIVGVTFGFLYQYALFRWIKPRVGSLLSFRIIRWLGFRDHFFFDELSELPEEPQKVKQARCILCQIIGHYHHEIHI